MEKKFKLDLDQPVIIITSGEMGVVVGRAEYTVNENSYCIHYKAADGRAVEAWWGESALAAK